MSKGRWQTIKTFVKSNAPNVFQVGANLGTEIAAFQSLWPQANIWSFEPRTKAFKAMKKMWGATPRLNLICAAVSKTQGLIKLYVNRQEGTSSLLEINTESEHYLPKYETLAITDVPTVTLDGFSVLNGIKNIGLLMIDAQGGELDVLKGAVGLLSRRSVGVIYTEVFFIDLYKNCPRFADVRQYLEAYGYRFEQFFNFGEAAGKPPTMWSDALFVKGD